MSRTPVSVSKPWCRSSPSSSSGSGLVWGAVGRKTSFCCVLDVRWTFGAPADTELMPPAIASPELDGRRVGALGVVRERERIPGIGVGGGRLLAGRDIYED